ncbi:hypothetical protein DUNSADRAFT_9630, partial [Dunaliella salina]
MLSQEHLHQPKPETGIKQEEEQETKPPVHIKHEEGDGVAEGTASATKTMDPIFASTSAVNPKERRKPQGRLKRVGDIGVEPVPAANGAIGQGQNTAGQEHEHQEQDGEDAGEEDELVAGENGVGQEHGDDDEDLMDYD